MNLRRQLVVVSLLTLALPWAGWQYLREMELAVRQGQVDSLTATARAVGARIAADQALMQRLETQPPTEQPAAAPLYAELLGQEPLLDGWQEEWQTSGINPIPLQSISDAASKALVFAGRYANDLYLLIRVEDPVRESFNPQQGTAGSDHLRLWLRHPDGHPDAYALLSAAPGEVQIMALQQGQLVRREYQLRGQWQEVEKGFQVELRLPYSWARGGLALDVLEGSSGALAATTGASLRPVVAPDPVLADTLKVFVDANTRLTLLNADGLVLARAGQLDSPERPAAQTLSGRLLRWLLKPAQQAQISATVALQAAPEFNSGMAEALASSAAGVIGWAMISRAGPAGPSGGVLAERSTGALDLLLNSAAGNLLLYSALATLLVGAGLLAYASYLSLRIRALSQAAHRAVDDSGRIQSQFPVSRMKDEIGDLSRSYAQLLARLRDYNAYLESLAAKLSHELRTPVAVVKSSLDNLQQQPLSAEAGVYAGRAQAGCERLTAILNAMSAAARLEQSLASSDWERVDLKALLEQLVEAYRGAYPNHHLELQCAGEPPYVVLAVPDLLVQLLDKLVDNACDFSHKPDPIVLRLDREASWVLIKVINRGPPLPSAMRGRIFDSLVSVREARGEQAHLGLGLHIARIITQHHQGEIAAFDDLERKEVTFEVRLPAAV